MIVEVAFPAKPLVVLLPVGLLGLLGRRTGLPGDLRGRRVFLSVVLVFVGLYMLHVSFLEHYAL